MLNSFLSSLIIENLKYLKVASKKVGRNISYFSWVNFVRGAHTNYSTLVNKWCSFSSKVIFINSFLFSVNCTIFFIDFIFKRPLENHFLQTFIPSMILSFSSAVSVFIPPDIVPGRMGMLITLFLILINSYNSVDAPPDRGNIRYLGQSQEL